MEILRELEDIVARGLGAWPPRAGMEKGGRFAVKVEEEIQPFLTASLHRGRAGPLLAVVPGRTAAEELCLVLAELLGEDAVRPLPLRELVIAGERGEDPEAVALRSRALKSLAAGEHVVVVCEAQALAQPFPSGAKALSPLSLRVDAEMDMDEAVRRIVSMGYEREYLVEGAGQFSVRGGIIDVFDPGWPRPVRMEFFGDRVERIRHFNPVDQRSGEAREEIEIYPVALPGGGDGGKKLLESLEEGSAVALLQPLPIAERLKAAGVESRALMDEAVRKGLLVCELDPMAPHPSASIASLGITEYHGRVDAFAGDLADLLAAGWNAVILLGTAGRRERLYELLGGEGIAVSLEGFPGSGVASLLQGSWSHGFKLPAEKLALFTERDIFGRLRLRAAPAAAGGGRPVEGWWDLDEGDYVVHVNHGIAVYGGLVKREVDGAVREYLLLRYGGGDSLYVPTDRIDLVHRYVGAEKPVVHRLSSHHWMRVKRRARSSVKEMAFDLLKLYTDRMVGEGYAFGADDPWQRELEGSFPYVETPDQESAIRDVKEDMEKAVPMDRLVYGDVGYGKTEVAVRAAFKAIMDGKQVAVLVPTTVLAQQHQRTFAERFASFPVRMETLSRFRGPGEQKVILDKVASGEVDLLIGTHRLLQDDVKMADLGLVIVDEEHRFGVAQKERLKALRRSVDVLTLTATPIPRTLQMSLSGIRDLSVIDTPIEERYAVITSVGPYDDELVREAMRRELAREGQVFYVHNRVRTIDRAARHVHELVPEARIVVGHGQMKERKLEAVMEEFISGRADVLVCTTIVESGLDIPNVNTLIVDGAENLGLSQLYHLRGRIGRSNRQAYAFFLFHEGGPMTEGALQRLKVIRDFSELGSGLRVAMKDLEIRGAGNLLGAEQHGHVEAVGFELYCRMLAEAVDELRGVSRPRTSEVTVDVPLRAFIIPDYVSKTPRRVEIYRRLAEAGSAEEVSALAGEVRDRYGPLPPEAENLFGVARLRLACMAAGIREVGHSGDEVVLRLGVEGAVRAEALVAEAGEGDYPWRAARYRRNLKELVLYFEAGSWAAQGREYMEAITRLLKKASAGERRISTG
ncbi:MAG: transcription-repair coupling factor [Actinobacteria bacterium]|jgi:transcription-repair coupling factor (superfamily II helicase)|nr:MAG: transcription-repair coupling factor [Actinomycetota bacterium]